MSKCYYCHDQPRGCAECRKSESGPTADEVIHGGLCKCGALRNTSWPVWSKDPVTKVVHRHALRQCTAWEEGLRAGEGTQLLTGSGGASTNSSTVFGGGGGGFVGPSEIVIHEYR